MTINAHLNCLRVVCYGLNEWSDACVFELYIFIHTSIIKKTLQESSCSFEIF